MSRERILACLQTLAIARQAQGFTEANQRVYAHLLEDLKIDHIAAGCRKLAVAKKGQFSSTMPTVGEIREAAEQAAKNEKSLAAYERQLAEARERAKALPPREWREGENKPVPREKWANFRADVAEWLRVHRMPEGDK